ncbi:MAG: divalent-cation tolerance protein CutA [Verrucomicrobiales bacterium]|jgi:periplasmic divalent cation tolerance protein|nr:divalent-cation tolerance protein CutA [Verrucomicrobiales bacterium]|tara:strand:+ start:3793 stop:4137 length:345 start_codon:yes stop_codon:yes gene_type:complete
MEERQNDAGSIILAITTFPNQEVARQIGTQIVEAQLAACVNILSGVESIYAWKGKVECESELLGLIKTTNENWEALEKWMGKHHPYEEPELIAISLEKGAAGYLDWVKSSVAGD